MQNKIPTLNNPIRKAVFTSQDVETFEKTCERGIKQQHINNYKKYIAKTLGRKVVK